MAIGINSLQGLQRLTDGKRGERRGTIHRLHGLHRFYGLEKGNDPQIHLTDYTDFLPQRRGTIHPDGHRDKLLSPIPPINERAAAPRGRGTGVGQDGQNGQDGQGQGLGHVKKRGFLQGILSKMDKIS